jgi:hypothetical protein
MEFDYDSIEIDEDHPEREDGIVWLCFMKGRPPELKEAFRIPVDMHILERLSEDTMCITHR